MASPIVDIEKRRRLPTLFEVLSRYTLAPVDLYSFYIYMRDQQRSVDYLDFWYFSSAVSGRRRFLMCLGSMSPSTCRYADTMFESSADRSSCPHQKGASDHQRFSITWSIWAKSRILASARQGTVEMAPPRRRLIRDSRHSFEKTPAIRPRRARKIFHSKNSRRRLALRSRVMNEGKAAHPVRRGIRSLELIFAPAR